MSGKLDHIAPQLIKPRINEWNVYSKQQFELACRSYERFDITQPPLIDTDNRIVCGCLMVQVAVAKGLNIIPVIRADHLSNEELRLYAVEAQSLAERAEYDNPLLSIELQQVRDLLGASVLQVLPFEQTRLDHLLNLTGNVSLTEDDTPEPEDEAPPISSVGEQWTLGPHRMLYDDAMLAESFNGLMNGEQASFTLTDGPYNLPASSISGRGRHKHRDFVQGAGEMSPAEFTRFFTMVIRHAGKHCRLGSLMAFFMGYRFLLELLRAGDIVFGRPIAICTWIKPNGGLGSFFRSRTEFIAYFKNSNGPYRNNVDLGKHGRNRTTAWEYAGMTSFSPERDELLEGHCTPKPVQTLKDAILDTTRLNDIVLDPFLGSSSLILAAHNCERRGYGIELDPHYFDVSLRRLRKMTGIEPIRGRDGASFSELEELAWDRREHSDQLALSRS